MVNSRNILRILTGDEYYRASRNGGNYSNRMRNDLLAQAFIAKCQKANANPI